MRNFFRLMMRLLVLVIVFLISMLTAMRFAIHTREVPIPKLIGMTPQQAQQTLAGMGLTLVRENRYFSADVPEGKIISQMPPPGEKVRSGWRVRIAESMGPQRAIIPELVGISQRAAELNIRRRGLDLGTVATINLPGAEADTVIAQDPPANATGVTSPKISLLISAPAQPEAYVMPDFVGQPLDTVIRSISEAGFKLGNVHTVTGGIAPSAQIFPPPPPMSKSVTTVIHQSPAPGQRITPETSINVEVTR